MVMIGLYMAAILATILNRKRRNLERAISLFWIIRKMEAYCSFDNYSDPCGAVKWAPQDKTFVPLLSCIVDLSGWLNYKYKGSGASGIRGRPAATSYSSLSGTGKWKYIVCA